jgi:hypothetical protein
MGDKKKRVLVRKLIGCGYYLARYIDSGRDDLEVIELGKWDLFLVVRKYGEGMYLYTKNTIYPVRYSFDELLQDLEEKKHNANL